MPISEDWPLLNEIGDPIISPSEQNTLKLLFEDQDTIRSTGNSLEGMIQIMSEVVEGRVQAVFHFVDDPHAPDVLALHRVRNGQEQIGSDFLLENSLVQAEKLMPYFRGLYKDEKPFFLFSPVVPVPRLKIVSPDRAENANRCIGLLAHDEKKRDLCRFVGQHRELFNNYDHILATDATGIELIKDLVDVTRDTSLAKKIHRCAPGELGGDIQIASEVLHGACNTVFFSRILAQTQRLSAM